jgi:hypothetical protein
VRDYQQGANPAGTNAVKSGAPSSTSLNMIIRRYAVYI